MRLRVVIEPDEDVFVAYCPELPGCVTYGKTEEEAQENIAEAIKLYLKPADQIFPCDAKISEIAI